MITSMMFWCYLCSTMLLISATPTLRFSDGRTRQLCSLPSGDASIFQSSFFLLRFYSHTPFADLWYLSFSLLKIVHIGTFLISLYQNHDVYLWCPPTGGRIRMYGSWSRSSKPSLLLSKPPTSLHASLPFRFVFTRVSSGVVELTWGSRSMVEQTT